MGSNVIGISLGMSDSCAAVLEGGQVKVIEDEEGSRTTASIVGFLSDGRALVGKQAERLGRANAENTIFAINRIIGRRFDDPALARDKARVGYKIVRGDKGDAWVEVHGKAYTPSQILAFVLQKMKEMVEHRLGNKVTEAVISVPTSFDQAQRRATEDAGRIAGLEVLRLINEPAAAALACGLEKRARSTVAVYELARGGFSTSILEISDGVFEVKSVCGDTLLGGEGILDFLADGFKQEHGVDLRNDEIALQRLRKAAEAARVELSSAAETRINLPFITTAPAHLDLRLTRTSIVDYLLQRSVEASRAALKEAALGVQNIDEVILVGHMGAMAEVQDVVRRLFGREPHKAVNPGEVAAIGAAIQAAVLKGDATPLSSGNGRPAGVPARSPMPAAAVPMSIVDAENILAGLNALADRIAPTFGPMRFKRGNPVGGAFTLPDPEQNAAARLAITLGVSTANVAGDGAAVTVLLARRMYAEALAALKNGLDPASLAIGLSKGEAAAQAFNAMVQDVRDPVTVAALAQRASGVDPRITSFVLEAMRQGGLDRPFMIGDAVGREPSLEIASGFRFDGGYLSPFFVTDAAAVEAKLEGPLIVACERFDNSILPLVQHAERARKPILVIAGEIDDQSLGTLMLQKLAGRTKACVVKAPGFGSHRKAMLADIAVATGGKPIMNDGQSPVDPGMLGRAARAKIERDQTTIIGTAHAQDALRQHLARLDQETARTRSDFDRERLQGRTRMLSTGIALMHPSNDERSSASKRAIEDALKAVAAVIDDTAPPRDGVVPGGGVAYLHAAEALRAMADVPEERPGLEIVCKALEEPLRVILTNAGAYSQEMVADIRLRGGRRGYDAEKGQPADLGAAGIFDTAKCARSALQNAIALVLVLTDRKQFDRWKVRSGVQF